MPFAPYHAIMFGESLVFDTSATELALNWKPKYTSTEALIESFEFFIKNRNEHRSSVVASEHKSIPKPGLLLALKWVSKRFISGGKNE
jgi:hypothetical protein